jgi:hypothetical protein
MHRVAQIIGKPYGESKKNTSYAQYRRSIDQLKLASLRHCDGVAPYKKAAADLRLAEKKYNLKMQSQERYNKRKAAAVANNSGKIPQQKLHSKVDAYIHSKEVLVQILTLLRVRYLYETFLDLQTPIDIGVSVAGLVIFTHIS